MGNNWHGKNHLTRREFKIYMLIVEHAMINKDIGESLGIGKDINQQIYIICRKMGVRTKLQLLVHYHKREQHGL